jgi:hypothetical protein
MINSTIMQPFNFKYIHTNSNSGMQFVHSIRLAPLDEQVIVISSPPMKGGEKSKTEAKTSETLRYEGETA